MSIPSTMTATLPPHSPHYGYQSSYGTNTAPYAANNSLPSSSSRLAPSYSFPKTTSASISRTQTTSNPKQATQSSTMPASQSTSALQGSKIKDRRPDWNEFYKHGPPKEIIVIDDDSPPPPPTQKENTRAAPSAKQGPARGEPTNKKRRTAYDAARDQ